MKWTLGRSVISSRWAFGGLLAGVLAICATGSLSASGDFAPGARLRYIETANFRIIYDAAEGEDTAREVGAIAEEVRSLVLGSLGVDGPPRYDILLIDSHDYANGTASGYPGHTIRLYMTTPAPPTGGASDISDSIGESWFREVFTHEFTHAVHLGRFTGWTNMWRWVFHTNPFHLIYPGWFVEGLAVEEETRLSSAGRARTATSDMIIRTEVLQDDLLPVGTWGHMSDWPGGGSRYLHGGLFLDYVQARFGPESLREIIDATNAQIPYLDDVRFVWLAEALKDVGIEASRLREFRAGGLERGFQVATGIPLSQALRDWKMTLTARYLDEAEAVRAAGPTRATQVSLEGAGTRSPAVSSDGRWVAYVAGGDSDVPGLELVDTSSGRTRYLLRRSGIAGQTAFSPDGRRLYFARFFYVDQPFDRDKARTDLFYYDLARRREVRISRWQRLSDPSVSPDGSYIVAIQRGQGQTKLVRLDPEGGGKRDLFVPPRMYQISTPAISPDGRRIAMSVLVQQEPPERARYLIGLVDAGGENFRVVPAPGVNREPDWIDDFRLLISSDRSGIFNLHVVDLRDGSTQPLTNLITGAFQPRVARGQGTPKVYFRGYTERGFDIFRLEPSPEETAVLAGGKRLGLMPRVGVARIREEGGHLAEPGDYGVSTWIEPGVEPKRRRGVATESVDPADGQTRSGGGGLVPEAAEPATSPGQDETADLGASPSHDITAAPAMALGQDDSAQGRRIASGGEAVRPQEAGLVDVGAWPRPPSHPYRTLSGLRLRRLGPMIDTDEGSQAQGYAGGPTLGVEVLVNEPIGRHRIYAAADMGILSQNPNFYASYANGSLGFPLSIYGMQRASASGTVVEQGQRLVVWRRGQEVGTNVSLPWSRGMAGAALSMGVAAATFREFNAFSPEGASGDSVAFGQQLDYGWGMANAWRNPAEGHFFSLGSSQSLVRYEGETSGSEFVDERWQIWADYTLRKWIGWGPLDVDLRAGHRSGWEYRYLVGGYTGSWSLPGIALSDGIEGSNVGVARLTLAQDIWRPQLAVGQVPWFFLRRVEAHLSIGAAMGMADALQLVSSGSALSGGLKAYLFTVRSGMSFVPQVKVGVDLRTGAVSGWFSFGVSPGIYESLFPGRGQRDGATVTGRRSPVWTGRRAM